MSQGQFSIEKIQLNITTSLKNSLFPIALILVALLAAKVLPEPYNRFFIDILKENISIKTIPYFWSLLPLLFGVCIVSRIYAPLLNLNILYKYLDFFSTYILMTSVILFFDSFIGHFKLMAEDELKNAILCLIPTILFPAVFHVYIEKLEYDLKEGLRIFSQIYVAYFFILFSISTLPLITLHYSSWG
jgi:hypothetical protein